MNLSNYNRHDVEAGSIWVDSSKNIIFSDHRDCRDSIRLLIREQKISKRIRAIWILGDIPELIVGPHILVFIQTKPPKKVKRRSFSDIVLNLPDLNSDDQA